MSQPFIHCYFDPPQPGETLYDLVCRVESADLPVDDSGEAELHECDPDDPCDDCREKAENMQDDLTEARIHDE